MQITMNNDQATVSTAKVNCFGEWIHNVTQKVAELFKKQKKETPKFTYTTVTDAIKFIEWRTWYDQQRILKTVKTISAIKAHPELCKALGIYYQALPKVATKVVLTDSGFDHRLVKFFGFEDLNPQTQNLLSGGETKAKKLPRTSELERMFLTNIKKGSQATDSYETRLLQELNLVLNAAQMTIDESEVEQQSALLALPVAEEVVDVVAETLPIEEVANVTETQVTEISTVEQSVTTEKSFSKKMTIKELKAYAKAHKLHVPGRKTKHRDIYEHIKLQLSQA